MADDGWGDVHLGSAGAPGSLTLAGEFAGWGTGVDGIEFADGTAWTRADLHAAYVAQAWTAGDDTVLGFGDGTAYAVDALEGDDAVAWRGEQGYGDRVVFGAGLHSAAAVVQRVVAVVEDGIELSDVRLGFAGAAGSLTIRGQFAGSTDDVDFDEG